MGGILGHKPVLFTTAARIIHILADILPIAFLILMSTLLTPTYHEEASNQMLDVAEEPHVTSKLWSKASVRFETALFISMASIVLGIMRSSIGMAMVDIVSENTTSRYKMHWSGDEQATIHTSFYIGAFASIFVAELLTKRNGAKKLIEMSVGVNAIGAILTPLVAIEWHNYLLVALIRLIMGFGYGFLVPAGALLIAKWFPIDEKSTAMAIFTTGNQLGIAIAMFLTAKLCQIELFDGWPIAFFVYGFISLLFLIIWHYRIVDKPRNSSRITATELEHIHGDRRRQRRRRAETVVTRTPYAKIVKNACVCAICACSFAQSFVLVAILTYLPVYNQSAMRMNLTNNAVWSSIPFITQMVTKIAFALFADHLKHKKKDASMITRAANGVASFGCAGMLIIVAIAMKYADHQSALVQNLVQFSIIVSMALMSAYVPGYNTAIVTIAPQYTAFVSAYAQLYANGASTLAPLIIGAFVARGLWTTAFLVLAVILILTGVAFHLFGHGRTESWGDVPSSVRASSCIGASVDVIGNDRRKKMSHISFADADCAAAAVSRIEELDNDVIDDPLD